MKKIALLLLVLAILEATALDHIKIFNIKPDLTLVVLVCLVFFFGPKSAFIFSFLAGFFKDILGTGPLGLNTLLYVLLIAIISKLFKKFIIESLSLRILVISLAVFLENIIAGLILPFYRNPIPLGLFISSSIGAAFYAALVSPLIIKIIRYI